MIPEFGEALPGVIYEKRPGGYGFLQNAQGEYAIVRTPAGYFLPGGGAEPGESPESALRREVFEEIGYRVLQADLICQANQYHWSEFYQRHFKKMGWFYRMQAQAPPQPQLQAEHELLWRPKDEALAELTQEFQRWALNHA